MTPKQSVKVEKQAEFDQSMLTPEDPAVRPPKIPQEIKQKIEQQNDKIAEDAEAMTAATDEKKKKQLVLPPGSGEAYKGLTRY